MGIWDGLKRASKAMSEEPVPIKYFAAGKPIVCDHCSNDQFNEGRAQLNTAGMTLIGMDWANQTATTLICNTCGRVHWFAVEPERR